ncbi:hypothetical protein BW731_06600 [Vagococcus martis]|uniref:Uncharacterized protein n=1 Tax=Vagococcus martis TaxID=1768210 RepID=A0A1V4DHX2_9ENTE|nr:hypothetical protein [Vagococcus martis]OPF87860.1 hypothetical protein BW731_06600 [Vagococcus martis]
MNDQNELDNKTTDEHITIEENVLGSENHQRVNESRQKKGKNNFWIIVLLLVIICGVVFYYMTVSSTSKKETRSTTISASYSLSANDKEKMTNIAEEITSYYEDSKRTTLKSNIDTSKLKDLKKSIDSVSDKTLKNEFLRLYKQLEVDINKKSVSDTNSLESSTNSLS